MDLSVPAMVSVDRRGRYELVLPGRGSPDFSGASLARLLDDATLHLMELVPKATAEQMLDLELCPYVELRKVKVHVKPLERKSGLTWKGRVPVILSRWPGDEVIVARPARIPGLQFAVRSTKDLADALARCLAKWAEDTGANDLDSIACRYHDYIEIIAFEADPPTILPSQPKVIGARKKKRGRDDPSDSSKRKRKLVPPMELRSVATNLTHRAIDGRLQRAHLRDALVSDLHTQVEHAGAGLLLVGPRGVGKTAIVHALVRRLVEDSPHIQDRREVWQVDGNRIIAGMRLVGAWEQRVGAMVHELSARQDILYVDDLPSLVFTGRSASSDTNVAQYLEPHLARGDLRIIGECTPERLLATRDEAPGFFARFRVIYVEPFDERKTLTVLSHGVRAHAREAAVTVEPEALEAVLGLTRRFEPATVFPGKAVSLLSRVIFDRGVQERDDLGRRRITKDAVIDVYGRQSGLPRYVLWERDARPIGQIVEFFERRIVAQPHAVEAAVDVVSLLEQALNDPARPLSTFLFVGPTGVGKTETAKALAELLFGSSDRMLRFGMSEFMAPHAVGRLFGDRMRPEGELTRRVRQQPFSIVLLDEIEKAHPAVFDALLQVLGEGRLTNAAGRTVDFSNTVIIMTSNLGVRDAEHQLGFAVEQSDTLDHHFRGAAETFFRPEFFNRIDRVVPFRRLGRAAIVPLARRMLERMLDRRGLTRNSVIVDIDPKLVEVIADRGFDPRYGARSIRRVLEKSLAVPLAQHLVTHRASALTLVELFPQRGDIRLKLSWPGDRAAHDAATVAGAWPAPTTWSVVAERFARVVRVLKHIDAAPTTQSLADEHSTLILGFNAGHLDDKQQSRLTFLGGIFTDRDALSDALDAFEARWLELPSHEEDIQLHGTDLAPSYNASRTLQVPDVRAARYDRGPLRDSVRSELERLTLDAAGMAFRVRAALSPQGRNALLRFVPVSRGARSVDWALNLARGFSEAWGVQQDERTTVWGTVTEYARDGEGVWCESPLIDAMASGAVTAAAIEISAPGVLDLVDAELGLHLDSQELGPDRLTQLVRVEDVGAGADPIARLSALDAELNQYRSARQADADAVDPRAELSMVRRYEASSATDAATGAEITLERFGAGLYQAALRRVLASFEGLGD